MDCFEILYMVNLYIHACIHFSKNIIEKYKNMDCFEILYG